MHRLIVLKMRIVGLRVVHHSIVLRVGRRTRVNLRLLSHAEVIESHGRHVRGINGLHGLNGLNGLNIPDVAHIGLQVVPQPLRHWIPLPRVIILSTIQTMLAREVLLQKSFLTTLSIPHLNRRVGPVGAIGLHLLHVPLDIHSFLLIDPHQKYLQKSLAGQGYQMLQASFSLIFKFDIMIIKIMKVGQRQEFSIKCECIITRNNLQINGKKKSKFSMISLNTEKRLLTAQPFGSQKEEDILTFQLAKLKAIHKKYIEQGKLTLEFLQKTEKVIMKGVDVSSVDEMREINSQILISSASKENLELLISKIVALKNSQPQVKNAKEVVKVKQSTKKMPADILQIEEKKEGGFNRKELMKSAFFPEKPKLIVQPQKKEIRVAFFDLPTGLIDLIFTFCSLSLNMRVINRRFSEYVIRNISSIKLKDQIDEKTFNKLCKWAVEVECRMKNVRSIDLSDKYQQQKLVKGRAKTLKFGNWKEISAKNILQLKGLRIYCLEIPYNIKFDLSNLFGLRLVELRLKANQITNSRSEFVKTEDLLYLLKTIKDLKVLELPYANTDLIASMENPKKMTQIKIYYLSDNCKDDSWKDLSKFQAMTTVSIWYLQKLGVMKQNHETTLTFPDSLKELEVGEFLSQQSLDKLPISIEYLKLIGQNYLNSHVQDVYLPNLNLLDITMSRNIRQDILDNMQCLSIITYWDRNTIDYLSNFAHSKKIRLSTKNPSFK